MSRVTFPDVQNYLMKKITTDSELVEIVGDEITYGMIIRRPLPKAFILCRMASTPTQLFGKRNVFDTLHIELHSCALDDQDLAQNMNRRLVTMFEKSSRATRGEVINSTDEVSTTYVSPFGIESQRYVADMEHDVPIHTMILTLSVVAHNWEGS